MKNVLTFRALGPFGEVESNDEYPVSSEVYIDDDRSEDDESEKVELMMEDLESFVEDVCREESFMFIELKFHLGRIGVIQGGGIITESSFLFAGVLLSK